SPDLGRHHPSEPGDLNRVLEAVLSVRGAELHPPDELDELGVEPWDADLEARPLALVLEVLLHLPLHLLDHFLDARGMDPAVGDQRLEREPGLKDRKSTRLNS